MRILIQRASEASVSIDNKITGSINRGLVLLLGIELEDAQEDVNWLVKKVTSLRIFNDANGTMNLSSIDVKAQFLLISQFTLHASTKKGNRPSYIKAARPEQAIPLYEFFIEQLKAQTEGKVATGTFGADMKVQLINDGPVTIWLDSKNRE